MAGLNSISAANFTKLLYGTTAELATTELEDVQSIGELGEEANIIEVQQYNVDYLRKLIGSKSVNALELVLNLNPSDPTHQAMFAAYKANTKMHFKLVMTDYSGTNGVSCAFAGYVSSKSFANEFDSVRGASIAIAIDGGLGDLVDL